mgnify:FL=1
MIKNFWNTKGWLAIASNFCTTLAIVLTLGILYLTNAQNGYQAGLNYYNFNGLHYHINESMAQLLLRNPDLKYSPDLPPDAYLAYLVMQDHSLLKNQSELFNKVQNVKTIKDYNRLRTSNPYLAQNKYGTEYDAAIKSYINPIFWLTLFAAFLQICSSVFSFRRDRL